MAYKKDDNGGQAAASAAPSRGSSSASGNYSRSGSPSASSKASPKPSARSSGGGSRDSSAHAAASADRAAAAGRGKVATFTPTRKSSTPWALDWADGGHGSSKQSRFGSGIDNSGRPLSGQFSLQGAPTKAGIYAGGGLNPSSWGSSFTSPIRGSDDPAFQEALDNLTIPVDYPDRNFHGIAPKKGADESYRQKAAEISYGRNLWAYNDTQGVFSRKYASIDEELADILDLMTHAQVYYKDALDKDYKFDVDGKEVSAADSWKDLYDRLDRYSGWLTDMGQTQDLLTRFENGDDIDLKNVDTMIARAQARLDNPYSDEDASMWQGVADELGFIRLGVNRAQYDKLSDAVAQRQAEFDAATEKIQNIYRSGGAGMFEEGSELETAGAERAAAKKALKEAKDALGAWVPNTNEERDALIAKMHENAGFMKGGLTAEEQQRLLELDAELGNPALDYGKDFVRRGDFVIGGAEVAAGDVLTSLATANRQITNLTNPAYRLISNLTGFDPYGFVEEKLKQKAAGERAFYDLNVSGSQSARKLNRDYTMVMESVPMVVASFMSGGATAAAGATTAGLEAAAASAEAGTVGRALMSITQSLEANATNPGFIFNFGTEYGRSYNEAIEDGASETEANAYAILNAYWSAAIEESGGLQEIPSEVQQLRDMQGNHGLLGFIKTAGREAIKSTPHEVVEEVTQGMGAAGLKALYQNVPLFSEVDPDAFASVARAKDEARGAAIATPLLGGGQVAATTIASNVAERAEIKADTETVKAITDKMNAGESLTDEEKETLQSAIQRLQSAEVRDGIRRGALSVDEAGRIVPAEGMEGYARRFSESELMQKIRASTQSLLDRRGQANADTQTIDNSGTIETQDQEIADAQAEALKGQETSPVPAPKPAETEEAPAGPETPQGEEEAPPQAETPESPQPVVKPEGSERQSDLGSKAAQQEKSKQNKAAHAQLQEENAARKKADDDAIENAWANREHSSGHTVSFEGTFQGKPATITYDAAKKTLTYTYEDGTSDTLTGVPRRQAKKYINEARSTLATGEAQPVAATQVEESSEEADAPEASGPDENIVSAIRNAQSIDELKQMYLNDPDSFAGAYEAVAGKPLSPGSRTVDEITELYDTLHQSEETEAGTAEAKVEEEATTPTESEEIVPAEPAEEIAEPEEESEPVGAEEPVEAAEPEEKAPELPEGPLKDRLHAGQVSESEITTRLGNPAARKEFKAELGLPSNASEAAVRNAVKLAALDHNQAMDDLQNGRFVAANIQTLVRTGKVTAEELSGVLRDAGIIGKKNVTGLPTLEKRYIQLQAKVNPDALTDADRAKLATQTKHDATVKKTNEETAADLKELTQARLDQKGDDTSASALYKEFTDDDRQAYKQQGADLITKGKLSAEEIVQLITKDSEALANYAAQTGHNPQQVRLALIEGYNQLTQDDIGLYGEKYAVKKVEEAIRQFRGSSFTVANYAGSKKKTDIGTLKEDQDVTGVHSEGDIAGRVATSKRGVEEAFGRILGDPAWAASFGGTGLGDAEGAAHYWEAETSAFTKVGGINLGYSDLKGVTKKAVDRLLTGLEGKPESRIPLVTVIDASNISEKDFNNVMGFVSEEGSSLGIWLIVNPPVRGKTAPGVVLLHEPVHYFLAKWREEQMGPEGKSFKEPMSLNFVVSLVQRFNKANSISIVGTKEDQIRSLVKSAQSVISQELRAYGRGLLSEYGVEFEDDEWDTFKAKCAAQQFAEIKTELNAIGEDYDSFFQRLVEELSANIAAGNEALDDGVFKVSEYKQAMRDLLYESEYVPTGFFENLDSVSAAWTKEANKKVSGKLSAGKKANGVKALKDISPEMHELQDLSRESTAEPPAYQPIDPEGIEEFYVQPSGEDTGVRTNTPISERITSQERAKAGEITYQQTSLKSVGQAAHESIEQILDHPEFGFDKLTEHLLNKNPAAINTLEQQMINELYARVQTQRHNLLHVEGASVDSRIPSDTKELWRLERQLRDRSSESAGEAARKVTQQRFAMTPEQEVLNNFSRTFLSDADPTTPDTQSIEARMYSIGATTVAGITDIDARRKAGEISEQQAVQEMLAMAREINKIRDVAKTFGPAGAAMARWEQACLDRIATKSDSAYDTLRMIALGSVNRVCSDFDSVGAINTLKQIRYLNLLSNPATIVSNLLNNFESSFSGAVGQTVGNKLAGKRAQRIMGGEVPLTGNANWHRGLIGKTNKALNEYMLTKGAESVLSLYYGLDVDEGVIDIDLGAKHNQNGTTASRLLATFQFMSGLNMTTTDAMAIARAYKGMEMEIDKMDVSPARKAELKADAMYEARRQMYHEDSKAAKAMENARDFLNGVTILSSKSGGKLGLGDVVMPFVQVPTNVAVRAMKASPVGIIYGFGKYAQGMRALEARRSIYDKVQDLIKRQEAGVALTLNEAKFLRENRGVSAPTDAEVRKLMRTLGSSCTNATATAFAVIAAMAGGLVDFDDEDDETLKRLAQERNFTGLQLNLSHILRLGRGEWKKDDVVIGGSWLQVLAIPMVAGHQIFKSWTDEDASAGTVVESILKSPFTTFQTFVDAAQEIPGVKQMVDIWDAYENVQQYGDFEQQKNKVVAGLSQYAANAASTFVIPNAVAQFAAGMDNTVRDVFRADKNWQIAVNILKNKIPWVRETIPELKTSLGDTRTYGSNKAMGIINRMVIPGTGIQKWVPTALEEEYRRIAESGENIASIAPAASAPSAITSLDGKEYSLNAEEARYFDENYTENTVRLQYALMNQPGYAELTDAQKAAAMNKLRQFEDHIAKTDFLLSRGDESGVAMDNWEKLYLKSDETSATISSIESAAQYAAAYAAATEIYSTKTRKFTGSDKTEWFLDNVYGKLSDDQKAAFDGSFPNMDKLYDGYKSVGLTAEEFEDIRATVRKYDDLISNRPDDISETAYQRDMMKEWEQQYSGKKLDWIVENNRIWRNRPVSTETIDKYTGAGLSISEADGWLDRKDKLVPPDDYESPPMNQVIQSLASYEDMSDKNKWITLMTDGDVSESARNNLGKYKLEHPNATLQDAVNNVSYWYKDPYDSKSKWEQKFYSLIYKNPNANKNKEYPYADRLSRQLGLTP